MEENILCDIRRQDCVRTRLIGDGFIDNKDLKCKLIEAKVCSSDLNTK